MILADTTPGSVRISSSARLIGSTLPAMLFKFNLLAGFRWRETSGQYCRRLGFNQAINCAHLPPKKKILGVQTTLGRARRCVFHITEMLVSLQHGSRRRQPPAVTQEALGGGRAINRSRLNSPPRLPPARSRNRGASGTTSALQCRASPPPFSGSPASP